MTVWKASWPLAGLRMAWVIEADTEHLLPLYRPTHYLPCSSSLRESLFQGRYIKVWFRGTMLPGLAPVIKEFVRQDEWVERDPLTGEFVP